MLIDAAHEKQLQKLQGNSIYNSYPSREMTEHKMVLPSHVDVLQFDCVIKKRLKFLSNTGLLRIMVCCRPILDAT